MGPFNTGSGSPTNGKSWGTISESFVSSRDHQPWKKQTASSRVCNYCQHNSLTIPPYTTVSVTPVEMERPVRSVLTDYSAFISKGSVSLPGLNKRVEVTILRDSGALDSFVLQSILPFSADTDTGENVIVRGMDFTPFFAPVYNMHLNCSLVLDGVTIAVRPELPVHGVDLILGNDFAGSRVWPDNTHTKNGSEHPPGLLSESTVVEPEGFPTGAVTRALAKKGSLTRERLSLN